MQVWPIDVASSSARFREAFTAMIEVGTVHRRDSPIMLSGSHTKAALLPGQHPSQYLTEEVEGVAPLVTSLLRQLSERNERQPHVIIASFSLHYLRKGERKDFYETLAKAVTRPLLLLILKGVDAPETKGKCEPMVPAHIPSIILGLHYYIGRSPKPRVAEAQLALILPAAQAHSGAQSFAPPAAGQNDAVPAYERSDPDSWVLSTFAAAQRHSRRHGIFTGVTVLAEEKLAARDLGS
jgi:hypothetical protein